LYIVEVEVAIWETVKVAVSLCNGVDISPRF
jgi:hypothetical protein